MSPAPVRSTVKVLRQARAKVEEGWTQGTPACDEKGLDVDPWSPRARSWCLAGAIDAVTRLPKRWGNAENAEMYLRGATGAEFLSIWNDSPRRTKKQVLRAFDKAIAKASA